MGVGNIVVDMYDYSMATMLWFREYYVDVLKNEYVLSILLVLVGIFIYYLLLTAIRINLGKKRSGFTGTPHSKNKRIKKK